MLLTQKAVTLKFSFLYGLLLLQSFSIICIDKVNTNYATSFFDASNSFSNTINTIQSRHHNSITHNTSTTTFRFVDFVISSYKVVCNNLNHTVIHHATHSKFNSTKHVLKRRRQLYIQLYTTRSANFHISKTKQRFAKNKLLFVCLKKVKRQTKNESKDHSQPNKTIATKRGIPFKTTKPNEYLPISFATPSQPLFFFFDVSKQLY